MACTSLDAILLQSQHSCLLPTLSQVDQGGSAILNGFTDSQGDGIVAQKVLGYLCSIASLYKS